MKGPRPWLVKVGGAICDEPRLRAMFSRSCASLKAPLVVVHGGGKQANRVQQAFGGEPRFVQGRRVTAPSDLTAVEMALSGVVNRVIVRDLIRAGRRAVGVSGCDAAMLRCHLVEGLGLVGRPSLAEPKLLEDLLAAGYTPVVSPISLGPSGEGVNVNADEAASALALALRCERLLLLSDVSGVIVGGVTREEITAQQVAALVSSGEIHDGMVPKLLAATAAAVGGVEDVRIAGFDGAALGSTGGTRLLAALGAASV